MNEQTGMTLTAEEMRAFSITKHQVIRRRDERASRVPRMLFLVCSVREAEDIVESFPEVRIVSMSRNLNKEQMLALKPGTVHAPRRGFQQGRE